MSKDADYLIHLPWRWIRNQTAHGMAQNIRCDFCGWLTSRITNPVAGLTGCVNCGNTSTCTLCTLTHINHGPICPLCLPQYPHYATPAHIADIQAFTRWYNLPDALDEWLRYGEFSPSNRCGRKCKQIFHAWARDAHGSRARYKPRGFDAHR